jgi:hypothetical protein
MEKKLYEIMLSPIDRQVRAVLNKYCTRGISDEEKEKRRYKDRIGELRERYEELRYCKVEDGTMESYDRYMNVHGILKKKDFEIGENPERLKQELRVALRSIKDSKKKVDDSLFSDASHNNLGN